MMDCVYANENQTSSSTKHDQNQPLHFRVSTLLDLNLNVRYQWSLFDIYAFWSILYGKRWCRTIRKAKVFEVNNGGCRTYRNLAIVLVLDQIPEMGSDCVISI